jgi:hypothetical protein
VETINSKYYYNFENGDIFRDGYNFVDYKNVFWPEWNGIAISGGTPADQTATTNNPAILPIRDGASANSGYCYYTGITGIDLGGGGDEFLTILSFSRTNGVVLRTGFGDTVTASNPADGAYIRLENGYLFGVLRNAASETLTTTSNQVSVDANKYFRLIGKVADDAASVTFWQLSTNGVGGYVTNWTDTITGTIPSGSARLTGLVTAVYHVAGGGGNELIRLDALGFKNGRVLER